MLTCRRRKAKSTCGGAVVAGRLALSILRSDGAEARARQRTAVEEGLTWRDPALALARRRYGADFQRALEHAISTIGSRERMLLRLHLVSGCSATKIARMFHVTQSTASRWLDQARERIADETRRLLHERLNLSASEIQSLATLVKSDLDLSLPRLLGTA